MDCEVFTMTIIQLFVLACTSDPDIYELVSLVVLGYTGLAHLKISVGCVRTVPHSVGVGWSLFCSSEVGLSLQITFLVLVSIKYKTSSQTYIYLSEICQEFNQKHNKILFVFGRKDFLRNKDNFLSNWWLNTTSN